MPAAVAAAPAPAQCLTACAQGVITVQDGRTLEDELEVVEGARARARWVAAARAQPPTRHSCRHEVRPGLHLPVLHDGHKDAGTAFVMD